MSPPSLSPVTGHLPFSPRPPSLFREPTVSVGRRHVVHRNGRHVVVVVKFLTVFVSIYLSLIGLFHFGGVGGGTRGSNGVLWWLQIWCGGGHRSDNGLVDEREKEKGKRKSSGVFTKLPFF
jgi:hypothetical protein